MQEENTQNAKLILTRLKSVSQIDSDVELANALGIKTNTLSGWKTRGIADWPSIFAFCEKNGYNIDWIVTGKGIPKKDSKDIKIAAPHPKVITITVNEQGNENAVLVPVKARAGYLAGYGDKRFLSKLPAYRLPKMDNKSYRIWEVEGYSMYDTLAPNDLVISSRIEDSRDVRDGRVYVFVCDESKTAGEGGVLIKRALNRIDKYGTMILKSDNITSGNEYPDIILSEEDIIEIWYADGYISNKLRDPRDIYDRLNNLEASVSMLLKSKNSTLLP